MAVLNFVKSSVKRIISHIEAEKIEVKDTKMLVYLSF